MAYNKSKIFKQAKEAIEKNNLFFIEDVVAFLPCGRSYFYDKFKDGTDEMDTIKEMLDENKVRTKASIRAKLYRSNRAAELLALYRLIATPEEHQRLNQSYVDQNSNDKKQQWPTSISFQVHPTEAKDGE